MEALKRLAQKLWFRARILWLTGSSVRKLWWRLQGAAIGTGTYLSSVEMLWPHQVSLGKRCLLEPGVVFKFDGVWQPGPSILLGDRVFVGRGCEFNIRRRITVGHDALIASGCRFIDHDHGIALGLPMNRQPGRDASIALEEDVWLGVNVVVLKGVTIGKGAIVGAGAVVTKPIPAGEIWAGVPAHKIGERNPGSQDALYDRASGSNRT